MHDSIGEVSPVLPRRVMKLRDEEDAYAVFWTTTPWTVPTNFAIVVGADIDYVEVSG